MNKLFCFTLLILAFAICQAQGTWSQKANFARGIRWGASGFSINGNGYVGVGWSPMAMNDFSEFIYYCSSISANVVEYLLYEVWKGIESEI